MVNLEEWIVGKFVIMDDPAEVGVVHEAFEGGSVAIGVLGGNQRVCRFEVEKMHHTGPFFSTEQFARAYAAKNGSD